tara:strand:+ start:218 stop:847 length:630 start_codon:yes stop_codon:yes gene_type:complete
MKMTNTIVSCDKLNVEADIATRVPELKREIAGLNDEKKLVDQFIAAMGSGKASAKHLATIFVRVIGDKKDGFDVNLISQVCNRLDKSGDAQGVTAIKRIYGAIFVGGKVAPTKDKQIAFKSKGAVVDVTALDRLVAAQFSGLSIRSTLVARVIDAQKDDTPKTPTQIASGGVKAARTAKLTLAAYLATVEATWKAQELEAANKAATKVK